MEEAGFKIEDFSNWKWDYKHPL